ncbi:uncharacterized protein LOC112568965 isoform X3 [Pomacea canaliculata]|uniref:uncharacterized protein LOC112568965 isoform X3 n=1 Tax=Pomacea canaliculata TaxID=400727 RepID=UPI000D73402D|nr:uncharacterized protein LOC112568965 isoform X3 [Pomacea canaliculata]
MCVWERVCVRACVAHDAVVVVVSLCPALSPLPDVKTIKGSNLSSFQTLASAGRPVSGSVCKDHLKVVNMWTTMILLLILLSVLSCLHAQNSGSAPSQQVQLQSNGMDYALFGYNSLKGCPLTLGYDPGFTFPIFSAQSQVTGDNGGPRGVVLSHDVSCVTSFTSTVVETPYDLTTLLTGTARLGADKWGPPFSASQHFLKFSDELKQNVLVLSTAVCSIYHVKLLLWEPPSFHSSFVDWIIKLNNTDDEDMFLKFLDTYGTHFVSRARFGASITVVHKMEDKVYRNLTESHVRSAASYVAAALFGQPQTLTSDQQKAANEFQNEVETTTIVVGVPLSYAGNSLTWLTAAKDQPSAIHYDLTSVEVLFSDTLMGNSSLIGSYGIDHVRIMNNILAVKTKYCWTVKRQDLTGECEGSSGKTLLSTKLMGKSEDRAAQSADQCVEGCYQLPGCVAVSFCPECRQTNLSNNCHVFSAGDIQRAVSDSRWHSTMLVDKLETFVKLHNTTVVVNSSSQSEVPPVTSVQDCYPSCIQDTQCVAFTLTDTSGSLIKCTRHTDSLLSLTQKTGVSVYFVSPLVKKIVRSGQTRDLVPSSMLNDWYKAACVIDDECRQVNSMCFVNRCRCRPGFFFSTRDYTCSATCSPAHLHTTFTEYPDSGIRGHSIVTRDGVSLQTCTNLCVQTRVCLSFDFRVTGGRCLLHEVTSLQAQSEWFPQTSGGWTHYQRTCLQFPTLYPGPQWYHTPCNISTVCPEPNSQCVSGRCVCKSPFILSGTDATCRVPESCRDLQSVGAKSGVYSIQLPETREKLRVWCDMDSGDGGWLVCFFMIECSRDAVTVLLTSTGTGHNMNRALVTSAGSSGWGYPTCTCYSRDHSDSVLTWERRMENVSMLSTRPSEWMVLTQTTDCSHLATRVMQVTA